MPPSLTRFHKLSLSRFLVVAQFAVGIFHNVLLLENRFQPRVCSVILEMSVGCILATRELAASRSPEPSTEILKCLSIPREMYHLSPRGVLTGRFAALCEDLLRSNKGGKLHPYFVEANHSIPDEALRDVTRLSIDDVT